MATNLSQFRGICNSKASETGQLALTAVMILFQMGEDFIVSSVKLPARRAGLPGHASGEQNVSKGNFILYCAPSCLPVGRDPAYPTLAGRGTFRPNKKGGGQIDRWMKRWYFLDNLR